MYMYQYLSYLHMNYLVPQLPHLTLLEIWYPVRFPFDKNKKNDVCINKDEKQQK